MAGELKRILANSKTRSTGNQARSAPTPIRPMSHELRAQGIDLGVLSVENVSSVEKVDSELRVLGTLGTAPTAPTAPNEHENEAGALYVARLPLR